MTDIAFASDKFAELVLFIAHKCRNAERFGSVKLSKILYYCDFEAFRRFHRPITGATYLKMPEGPVPKELFDARRTLVKQGIASVELRRIYDFNEERIVPVSDHVELSDKFSDDEHRVINEKIASLMTMSAADITDYSHGEFGWQYGEWDEPIPYSTALIARSDDPRLTQWIADRVA